MERSLYREIVAGSRIDLNIVSFVRCVVREIDSAFGDETVCGYFPVDLPAYGCSGQVRAVKQIARIEGPRFVASGSACRVGPVRNDGIAQVGCRLGAEVDVDERALGFVGVQVERVVVVAHPIVVAQVFACGDCEGLVHVADQRLGQILEIDRSLVREVDAISILQNEMPGKPIAALFATTPPRIPAKARSIPVLTQPNRSVHGASSEPQFCRITPSISRIAAGVACTVKP